MRLGKVIKIKNIVDAPNIEISEEEISDIVKLNKLVKTE